MIINDDNKEIIDSQIYIHDSIFSGFDYNYKERQLKIVSDNYFLKKTFCIKFYNIIFLNCNFLDMWGGDTDRILDWQMIESSFSFDSVKEDYTVNPTAYIDSKLDDNVIYFSTRFTLTTGSTIETTCEKIEFTEQPL